jgi:hypothetical protein
MMSILVKGPTASKLVLVLGRDWVREVAVRMHYATISLYSLGYPAARLFSREQIESGVYAG